MGSSNPEQRSDGTLFNKLILLPGQLREHSSTLEALVSLLGTTPEKPAVTRKPRNALPKPQRQLTQDEIRDLVQRRLEGVKINDLAAEFRVHRSTVLRQLRLRLKNQPNWFDADFRGRLDGDAFVEILSRYTCCTTQRTCRT